MARPHVSLATVDDMRCKHLGCRAAKPVTSPVITSPYGQGGNTAEQLEGKWRILQKKWQCMFREPPAT